MVRSGQWSQIPMNLTLTRTRYILILSCLSHNHDSSALMKWQNSGSELARVICLWYVCTSHTAGDSVHPQQTPCTNWKIWTVRHCMTVSLSSGTSIQSFLVAMANRRVGGVFTEEGTRRETCWEAWWNGSNCAQCPPFTSHGDMLPMRRTYPNTDTMGNRRFIISWPHVDGPHLLSRQERQLQPTQGRWRENHHVVNTTAECLW